MKRRAHAYPTFPYPWLTTLLKVAIDPNGPGGGGGGAAAPKGKAAPKKAAVKKAPPKRKAAAAPAAKATKKAAVAPAVVEKQQEQDQINQCIVHCLETGDKLPANLSQIMEMSGTIKVCAVDINSGFESC